MRRKSFRIIATLLICMLFTTGLAFGALPQDVEGQSYETAVEVLMERGAITGDVDGLYHPQSTLTRAQACAIIVRAMDPPAAELVGTATQAVADSGFKDLTGYSWAAPYINYAVNNGITKGVGNQSFAPGSPVTVDQVKTFLLRAAGYMDEDLGGTWPENYGIKWQELDLSQDLPQELPELATKWMMAQMTYNALSKIDAHQGTTDSSGAIQLKGLTYLQGSFDTNITTFDGVPLDKNVTVYAYLPKNDYKSSMTLSTKTSDYREETVYKYKNVATPAWVHIEDGEITQIILPRDVGFSGRVYGVINNTITIVNYENTAVTGFETLAAGQEITWLGKEGLTYSLTNRLNGQIYELSTSNGVVTKVADETSSTKFFNELSTASTFTTTIFEVYNNGVYRLTNAAGPLVAVKDNATVYVYDTVEQEYVVGRLSNVKVGKKVRFFDISDDDETTADLIVVEK